MMIVISRGWSLDTNGDGLGDVWQEVFGAQALSAAGDRDGDGSTNQDESLAGTNPLDPADCLQLEIENVQAGAQTVTWHGEPGRRYRLEYEGEEGVTVLSDNFIGDGGMAYSTVPAGYDIQDRFRLRAGFVMEDDTGLLGEEDSTDTDGDGQGDFSEFLLGSDPVDASSRWNVSSHGTTNAVTLRWQSAVGKSYRIERSVSLEANGWEMVGRSVSGTGGWVRRVCLQDTLPHRYFYRLAVENPDTDADSLSDWDEAVMETDPLRAETVTPAIPGESMKLVIGLSRAMVWLGRGESGAFRLVREGMLGPEEYQLVASGTAIAGEDYEPLPYTVSFKVGQRTMDVPVHPLDGGVLPGQSKTVTLNVVGGRGRSVQKKTFSEVTLIAEARISVKDHGAAGDGLANDTAAVQSAIQELERSPGLNTLWFPAGRYRLSSPVLQSFTPGGLFRLLQLGPGGFPGPNLAGRDILIAGEAGSVLFSDVGTLPSHILLVRAYCRSLAVRGMTFEKSTAPRTVFDAGSEPNGSDGIALVDYYGVKLAEFSMLDCQFINCHCAVRLYSYGSERWGNLGVFRMERCLVSNPYGANVSQSPVTYGGGQQLSLGNWVDFASYENNEFTGEGDAYSTLNNPTGKRKDGSHFGSPRELRFAGNRVRRMGMEAVFQTNTPEAGAVSAPFHAPPQGGDPVSVSLNATYVSSFRVGQHVNFRVWPGAGIPPVNVLLKVLSFNATARTLMVENDGAGSSDYGGLIVGIGTILNLQEAEPTRATIFNNLITDGGMGIAINAKAKIHGNLIRRCGVGVQVYEEVRSPLNPAAKGTRIHDNLIVPPLTAATDNSTSYGVQSWGPEETVSGNFVLVPRSVRVTGICMRGVGSWAYGNRVRAAEVVRNGYGNSSRAVGIGIGNTARDTRVRYNSTNGFDVGLGPAQAYQIIPFYSRGHTSDQDAVPIDFRGLIPE